MSDRASLSWGLVIATYRREKVLPLCLQLATEQTCKPTEIIVVDASDTWETTRSGVLSELATQHPDIRWIYTAADHRSLTLQRNQGIQLATADIVFLFDDDTFMYPLCAEEIMRVYEADAEGVVRGVQAYPEDKSPLDVAIGDAKHYSAESKSLYASYGVISAVYRFIWKQILLMDSKINFIPYTGEYPTHKIPAAVQQLNIQPEPFLAGFRMTYRRTAVLEEPFEPLLRYYAVWEDVDASYRVSCHGLLLTALNAKVHHFYSASGRVNRLQIAALASLNQAIFLKKYSTNLKRDLLAYYWLMARRLVAEGIKDTLARRWTFPQLRGAWLACYYSRQLFALPEDILADWYPKLQQKILALS